MMKRSGFIGTIKIDVFHQQVGVFESDKARRKYLSKRGVNCPVWNNACFASAHMDIGDDGAAWFSMVIKPEANLSTLAHECVHIADWIMGRIGIPCDEGNTEIRGYLVGHLFGEASDLLAEAGK